MIFLEIEVVNLMLWWREKKRWPHTPAGTICMQYVVGEGCFTMYPCPKNKKLLLQCKI